MKKNILIFLTIIFLGLIFVFTNKSQPKLTNNKLQVTTSFYPLYFFASEIGGDKANVKNITPVGAEPHDYEPTTQDIARIEKSSLLILNGGVEAWGDKIKENLKDSNAKIISASDNLLTKELTEEGKTIKDPHVWLDPILAKKEVTQITDGYIKTDPTNAIYYQTNQTQLNAKLDKLDIEFKTGLATCKQKNIITSHAAFGYLAARYGLNQVAVSGVSPDAEPSSQNLANVAKFAKENNVKYIFFESLVSPKLSETIAREVGAKTLVLDPLEGISDDDMKQGKNYFTVMKNNLKNLQKALECNQ
ncbi:zinc ABC transporter substrate-binding protein [Candidatus Roizmanbacteria bacterium]|nr:zinc ABC transporter substrate-binding protein [Candidatus Roizmanbacteria bacterium]